MLFCSTVATTQQHPTTRLYAKNKCGQCIPIHQIHVWYICIYTKKLPEKFQHSCKYTVRPLGGASMRQYPWLQDSLRLKIVFLRTDLVWVAQETGWTWRADSSHYKQQVERMYHGNPKPSFLGVMTHILSKTTFIFHGFGVQR